MCEWGDTVMVSVGQKTVSVDRCIAPFVNMLNACGIETKASCCGHGHLPGSIILADGRELLICRSSEEARLLCATLGVDIHGQLRGANDATSRALARGARF